MSSSSLPNSNPNLHLTNNYNPPPADPDPDDDPPGPKAETEVPVIDLKTISREVLLRSGNSRQGYAYRKNPDAEKKKKNVQERQYFPQEVLKQYVEREKLNFSVNERGVKIKLKTKYASREKLVDMIKGPQAPLVDNNSKKEGEKVTVLTS